MQWQEFWDKFVAAVDNSDLPAVSKLTYLQSLLRGEAKSCLQGLPVTADQYPIACSLLKKRFGRRERIVFAHVQALLNVPACSSSLAAGDLRRLHDDLQVHVRCLEAIGITGEQYGVVLTPVLLSRLPSDVRMEWARQGEDREGDLDFLLHFLCQEVERREMSDCYRPAADSAVVPAVVPERKNPRRHPSSPAAGSRMGSAVALPSSAAETNTSCAICSQHHRPWKCPVLKGTGIKTHEQLIRDARLCVKCLNGHHIITDCTFPACKDCGAQHNRLLCTSKHVASKSSLNVNAPSFNVNVPLLRNDCEPKASADEPPTSNCMTNVTPLTPSNVVQMQTAQITVKSVSGECIRANALFDSGADQSYVTTDLAKRAGLKCVGNQEASVSSFGGKRSKRESRNVFELECLKSKGPSPDFMSFTAVEMPVISAPVLRPSLPVELRHQLSSYELADPRVLEPGEFTAIDLLIGLDFYWEMVSGEVIRLPHGPVLQESVFGYLLSGRLSQASARPAPGASVSPSILFSSSLSTLRPSPLSDSSCMLNLNDVPDSMMTQFWDLETIGIRDEPDRSGDNVMSRFKDNIRRDAENRYEVGLLWKEDRPLLRENRVHAEARLKSLCRRFDRNPALKERYDEALNEMETSGVIEEVPPDEVSISQHPVYYLPHRPVIKESSSSTKVRPVFDASAPGPNGISLNDCLHAGPALTPHIVDVLLRFRRWPVALAADITKAFLQVSLREEDRDVHRFLWLQDAEVRVMRFRRVTFGVNCSPYLLNATIRHHLARCDESHVVRELKDNMYVDDWLTGADSPEEATCMFAEASSIMADAKMKLSKWTSNCSSVEESIQEHGSIVEDNSLCKVLGIRWMPETDAFAFDGIPLPVGDVIVTKRLILSIIARIYDPVGFVAPVAVWAKLLFQELWRAGVHWDQELQPAVQSEFNAWLEGIQCLRSLQIPRCYFGVSWSSCSERVEVHVFGDASEKAYGCCCYLRVVDPQTGSCSTSLVMSKARVAPLKGVTVPRLELTACVLSVRMGNHVKTALQLPSNTPVYHWTDSTIALSWIRGDPSRWKP